MAVFRFAREIQGSVPDTCSRSSLDGTFLLRDSLIRCFYLLGQPPDDLLRLPNQLVPRLRLLLVGVEQCHEIMHRKKQTASTISNYEHCDKNFLFMNLIKVLAVLFK